MSFDELFDFEPGTVQSRAFDLLHAVVGDGVAVCASCAYASVAVLCARHGADAAGLARAVSELVYTEYGTPAGIAFDAIAFGDEPGVRARFDQAEALYEAPAPSPPLAGVVVH